MDYTLSDEVILEGISPDQTIVFRYNFTITDDVMVELDEVFMVTLSSGAFSASTTVVIIDDDST